MDRDPGDPRRASLRASDADREQFVEALRQHHAEGRLTLEELTERTERAYAARTLGDLDALTSDLPPIQPPVVRQAQPGDAGPAPGGGHAQAHRRQPLRRRRRGVGQGGVAPAHRPPAGPRPPAGDPGDAAGRLGDQPPAVRRDRAVRGGR